MLSQAIDVFTKHYEKSENATTTNEQVNMGVIPAAPLNDEIPYQNDSTDSEKVSSDLCGCFFFKK